MADPKKTQNPAAVSPAPPANLGTGQIAPIDVSKGVTVDPRTGAITLADPRLPDKPVSSQTIEQPAEQTPGVEDSEAAFADRLATERAQNSTGSITDQGTVDVGTVEQNLPQKGELGQGSRILNPRQISEKRPNEQSPSEAVRNEASGATRHMPVDLSEAGHVATLQRVQRIADIATGKEKGLTGEYGDKLGFKSPILDATLEAMNLTGDVSGDMLAKTLISQGVEKNTAETIGFAARMLGGLGYAKEAPLLLGAPAAIGRYARDIGVLGKGATTMEEAATIARAAAERAVKESVGLHRDFVSTGKALGIEGGELPKGTKVFHGTGQVFDKAEMEQGLWVAENPKTAGVYAVNNRGEAPNVRPYMLAPDAKLASEAAFNYDLSQADNVAALRSQGYDAVFFEGKESGKGAHYLVLNPDALVERFTGETAAVVNRLAEDAGTTPRFAQEAVLASKRLVKDLDPESATLLSDHFVDTARAAQVAEVAPSMTDNEKGLAVAGGAAALLTASMQGEQDGGVTPDHVEAAFPGAAGNLELIKVLVDAVRKLRNVPGKVRPIGAASETIALDVLTAPQATIRAGDKLLGLDWVGMSKDADHLPNTIKTVREAFDAQIKADSRGVVSHQMEREMAKTLTDLGYDPAVAVAKWQGGDRSVVSTEIMATAALTKAAYAETDRLARVATKLEGTEAGARALEDYGRQLGVFGSLVQVLDGQAEEAGRALAIFRSMVPEIPSEARAMAKGEMELAQKGISPMGGKVAEAATAEGRQAAAGGVQVTGEAGRMGAGAEAAGRARGATRGGAFQGPPTPQAVLAAGNAAIANAQQVQAQYLQQMLSAWNLLPKSQQRGIFLRELGKWGLDLVKEAFYNSMLFTFPGQLANQAGNAIGMVGEQLSRIVGASIGAVRHDVMGLGPAGTSLNEISAGSFQGMVNAVTEAFVTAGKSFGTGTPQSRGVMGASLTRTPYALTGERVGDVMALAGVQIPNAVYHGVNVLGATLGAGTRGMMAGDEWWKVVHFRGEINRLGIQAAEKQGLKGKELSEFMQAYLSSPPAEDIKAARDYAHYVTYTNPLTGTLAAIGTVGHSTLMTPFTPFFDTLVNIGKYDLEWVPGLNMLVKKSREDLAHMGPRQDQALAKLGLGSAMMVAAYSLYNAGYITGPGPSDKNLLRTMVEVNKWQPNSFVFTDSDGQKHYVGFNRLDPAAFPFAFVGAYGDIALEALNGRAVSQDTAAEVALAGVHALGEVATTRNYAQGFQQALELITAKDLNTFNKLQKFSQRLAGSVVPSGVAQINKEIDPYQRATYSALDQIYSRLPGKSKELYPDVNLAGQDRFKTAALGPDWISPLPYSKGEPDVVGQALVANGVSITDVPQSIFGPPPPALVGEENSAHGILLNAKQHYRYKHLAGNDLKRPTSEFEPALRALGYTGDLPDKKMGMWDLLTALVQTKTFTDLTPGPQGMQHKVLSSIIQGYRRAAQGQLLKEDKDLREKFFGKVLDRAESFGGPRARAQAEQAIRAMDMDAILSMTGNE